MMAEFEWLLAATIHFITKVDDANAKCHEIFHLSGSLIISH